nr:SDR family oxidoreductase [Sphingomonas sp. Y57]
MSGDERRAIVAGEGPLAGAVTAAIGRAGFTVEQAGWDLSGAEAVDLVVALPITDIRTDDFAALAEDAWVELAERPVDDVRRLLAAASPRMREPGGAVLIALPNIGMIGVAGAAAQTMAAEGIRALSKAVAKAWRPRGIRVNCAMLSIAQLADADGDVVREIAGIATASAGADFAATGNSILIDGEQTSV